MSKRLVQCEPEAEVLYRDRPTLSPTSWLNERKSQVLADFNEDRSIRQEAPRLHQQTKDTERIGSWSPEMQYIF